VPPAVDALVASWPEIETNRSDRPPVTRGIDG